MNWFRPSFDPLSATDSELVVRLRSGDEACWRELYRRHQDRLYRYALRMTGSAATASDITQETFVAFLEQAHRYDPAQAPLGAWLLGIARNRVRKSFTAAAWEPLDDAPPPIDPSPDAEDRASRAQVRGRLRRAVLALPEPLRVAVTARYWAGLTSPEIPRLAGVAADDDSV